MAMISEIEDYFARGCGRCQRFDTPDCSARHWEAGLAALRRICMDAGLGEVVKWGHPCYVHEGRNIVVLGAFRDSFRMSFMNAALMRDPENILERQGPQTRYPNAMKFTSAEAVLAREASIRAYLEEAKGYAERGLKAASETDPLEIPSELQDALDEDPALAEAFRALTRGRQNSYVVNLKAAKKSETRVARITKFRGRILAGKGAMER